MSALRIAAVTQVLRGLLREAYQDSDVASIGTAEFTAVPPDAILPPGSNSDTNQLNLYMYYSTINQGWKNFGVPTRDADGRRVSSPPLVLDLHYMLSAYGSAELHAEMLLGYAIQMFHDYPIMSKDFIDIQLTLQSSGGALPNDLDILEISGLSEQIEQIKISPDVLSTEEMTRLWNSFGARHRYCFFYKVTAVMLEKQRPTRVVLPVEKALIKVVQFAPPIISALKSRTDPSALIIANQTIFLSSQLVIEGTQLLGETTEVYIGGEKVDTFVQASNTEIILDLPQDLEAGLQSVRIVHKIALSEPPEKRKGFSSNVEAFILSPDVRDDDPTDITTNLQLQQGTFSGTISITVLPLPTEDQKVTLILTDVNDPGRAYSFQYESPDFTVVGNKVRVPVEGLTAGTFLLRLMINNAISPVVLDGVNKKPRITIP